MRRVQQNNTELQVSRDLFLLNLKINTRKDLLLKGKLICKQGEKSGEAKEKIVTKTQNCGKGTKLWGEEKDTMQTHDHSRGKQKKMRDTRNTGTWVPQKQSKWKQGK